MNNKFSKNELLEMINSGLTKLTEEEILELITEELNKENAQVDMDYIDICYDLLEIKRSGININTTKPKIKKPIKVLLIAAAFSVVIISTLTVSAQLNLNIPQKIAQLINGNAKIDYNLENADTTADGYALLDSDLAKQLADYGVTPVTFPEEMIKERLEIIKIDNITTDSTISLDVYVEFNYNNAFGTLTVSQYVENLDWVGEQSVMEIVSGQMIQVNGMDILLFEQKDSCIIQYKDNLTEYNIHLKSDIKTAIEFAKSIK